MAKLKAPFPAFGGKSAVAATVWSHLGDVDNYIEPFCFSAAVLWARRDRPRIETINDENAFVANFWRATQCDPEGVAEHCDYPVSEVDLHARHRWLVLGEGAKEFRERVRTDPDYFDVKRAGWWCWGLCCWIGGAWCEHKDGVNRRPMIGGGEWQTGHGVHASGGTDGIRNGRCSGTQHAKGVHAKRPQIGGDNPGSRGRRVHGFRDAEMIQQVPHSDSRGVPSTPLESEWSGGRPQLADAFALGRVVNAMAGTCEARRAWLLDWFGRLRDRLRNVRVCCGHWARVCDSPSVTTRLGLTGLFIDPPYPIKKKTGGKSRAKGLYANDGQDLDALRDEILAYCMERGGDRQYRIVLACYEGDGYEPLAGRGWVVHEWKANGGYGNRTEKGKENAKRERLYISPHCVGQRGLFDGVAA